MSGRSFWVLFDIATLPPYYRDVHTLLASPPGALMRYDYRDPYLTDDAIAAVTQSSVAGDPVLFIYVQWDRYVRGSVTPALDTPASELRWQAMRLGEMVATWREQDNNYLQFTVGDYPAADPALLDAIRAELEPEGATPYRRLVALSKEAAALASLRVANPKEEWSNIVTRLGTAPMQFAGDPFWRLDPPLRTGWIRKGSRLGVKLKPGQSPTPEMSQEWIVPERAQFALPIALHERHDAAGLAVAEPTVAIRTPADGPIYPASPDTIRLRRNAVLAVPLESRHSADAGRKIGPVTVATEPTPEAGANEVTMLFQVRLARWKRAVGAILGLIAIVATPIAVEATKITTNHKHIPAAVGAAIAVILVGVLGAALYTGKLPMKT
jgi:hypothetical protein